MPIILVGKCALAPQHPISCDWDTVIEITASAKTGPATDSVRTRPRQCNLPQQHQVQLASHNLAITGYFLFAIQKYSVQVPCCHNR